MSDIYVSSDIDSYGKLTTGGTVRINDTVITTASYPYSSTWTFDTATQTISMDCNDSAFIKQGAVLYHPNVGSPLPQVPAQDMPVTITYYTSNYYFGPPSPYNQKGWFKILCAAIYPHELWVRPEDVYGTSITMLTPSGEWHLSKPELKSDTPEWFEEMFFKDDTCNIIFVKDTVLKKYRPELLKLAMQYGFILTRSLSGDSHEFKRREKDN